MKILVVDDERLNLKISEGYLKSFMPLSEIFLCSNPNDVIDIIIKNDIDIVFLDIMMPRKTGFEVLLEIRQNSQLKDVQVIMLTGLSDTESFKKCFDIGANDYIKKPIVAVEMQARLKAAIMTRTNIKILKEMYQKSKVQNNELEVVNRKLKDAQFHIIQKEKLASIGELAAGVAHEINNPLGYVASNIETLQRFSAKIKQAFKAYREYYETLETQYPDDKVISELTTKVKSIENALKIDYVIDEFDATLADSSEGIERVAKIVQTLKNFARTGTENEMSLNNINDIIAEVLLIVKNEAKYSIDIRFDYSDIPDIKCNRSQIGQVILNILVNAIQAIKAQNRSDRGNIRISTSLSNNIINLGIYDDGPGIPANILSKIFDPFFTTKDVGQGTGLGLSISHDIIAVKHHGEIKAGNNDDKGAFFEIKLPVDQN